jgi:phosphoglycolate phosphatase-like HAD superfamily hydrolase
MRILLFDIDGTLLASGGAGKFAMESALLEEFGLPALTAQVPYSGRTDRAIGRDLLRLHGIDPTPANFQRLHEAYLHRLPNALARQPGRVLPGVVTLLESLAGRSDVAVGLLTGNIAAGAAAKLGHYGLAHHFAFGGYGDRHWERDDVAREALSVAGRHLGRPIDLNRVWVIGDTPLDVACARAIGARAVAVATGWHSLDELAATSPDLLLPDLADHGPLMAQWA